jgi:hypothetical protein
MIRPTQPLWRKSSVCLQDRPAAANTRILICAWDRSENGLAARCLRRTRLIWEDAAITNQLAIFRLFATSCALIAGTPAFNLIAASLFDHSFGDRLGDYFVGEAVGEYANRCCNN